MDHFVGAAGRHGPVGVHLEPVAAVDQRVADDDGPTALDVEDEVVRFEGLERADAERQRVSAAEHLSARSKSKTPPRCRRRGGRDHPIPRLARPPLRVRGLPVPDAGRDFAHAADSTSLDAQR